MHEVDRIAGVCPGFRGATKLARSIKCQLIAGQLDGREVVAKVLVRPDPVWQWYFDREPGVLDQLPPTALAPAVRAADTSAGVLVLDRAPGRAVFTRRAATREIAAQVLDALLDAAAGWNELSLSIAAEPRAESIRTAMRKRLLEDPDHPLDWFFDGFERCATLGIVTPADAANMTAALSGFPTTAFCHGDLLLRNVISDPPRVCVVDWECAGEHALDWDRALLWANLVPTQRAVVESIAATGPDRRAAFYALAAFAVAREIKFARNPPADRRRKLNADLRECLDRL